MTSRAAFLRAGCAAIALTAYVQTAPATARSATHRFDIVQQDLESALKAYALVSGLDVLIPPELVQGKRAAALHGSYEDGEALRLLLAGSGLAFELTSPRMLVIRRATPTQGSRGTPEPARLAQERGAFEEIVVTAQKRAENIKDVPAAISVISGDRLNTLGANKLMDYAAYVPGLNVNNGATPGFGAVTLRGITPLGPGSTVGTYIDDAPMGSSSNFALGAATLDLFPYDIERVEVLRGPQGTLYGASTMGGLLKYVMRTPDSYVTELQAGADLQAIKGAGKIGRGGRAAANLPLVEGELAVRISAYDQMTPGYIDNFVNGAKNENEIEQKGARFAAAWTPVDGLTLKLSSMWQKIHADNRDRIALNYLTLQPLRADLTSAHLAPIPFKTQVAFNALSANWDVGWATLTSASSYAVSNFLSTDDQSPAYAGFIPLLTGGQVAAGLVPVLDRARLKKFTQELRLASPGDQRLSWLAGAFYTYEQSQRQQVIDTQTLGGAPIAAIGPLFTANIPSSYREIAAFGDATYKFTGQFDITAGLRVARNTQSFTQAIRSPVAGNQDFSGHSSQTVTTFLFSPRFHLSPDTMVYGRIASSYRPGGANALLPGSNAPRTLEPDRLVSYELGVKSELLDHTVQVEAAVFRINWKDIQLDSVDQLNQGVLINGGSAISQGIELSIVWAPVTGLRLGANTAFTDATLGEDVPSMQAKDGDRLQYVPRWNAAATADYEFGVGSGWIARLNGGYRFTGGRYTVNFPPRPGFDGLRRPIPLGSYGIVDVNATLSDQRWTLRVYAKNLFDKRSYLTASPQLGGAGVPTQVFSPTLQPRTIGLSVDVKF